MLIQTASKYFGTQNILLTPSGRGSLYFLLKAIEHSVVIVPAYTCKAVVEACFLAGKEILYVDTEPGGFNIVPESIRTIINDKCVVLATHQFGFPCDIQKIVDIAHSCDALVIEDAAAALGTRIDGKLAGTFGDAAFFSFDSTKLITVPLKGGMLTAKSSKLFADVQNVYHAEISSMPAWHKLLLLLKAVFLLFLENQCLYKFFHLVYFDMRGIFTTDDNLLHLNKGAFYTYDFEEWQASIALSQFQAIDRLLQNRRRCYRQFHDALQTCLNIELPPADTDGNWGCIRFPIRIKGDKMAFYRELVKLGIDCAFSFTYIAAPETCKQAHMLASSVLDIPFYQKLTNDDAKFVINAIMSLDEHICQQKEIS